MALDKIHLRKLLQLLDAPPTLRTRLLRADVRNETLKETRESDGGGDFFAPFWADAKHHVAEELDLGTATTSRIDRNERRRRLYPQLMEGFLKWWNEKRRWRNEPFKFIQQNVRARLLVPEVGCEIKIESLLAVDVVGQFNRIVYAYFSEKPPLTADAARIGLWALGEGITVYNLDELRILDVLRSVSYGIVDCPLTGNERQEFVDQFKLLEREWNKLKDEYDGR